MVWEPKNGSIKALQTLDPNRPTIYFTLGSTGLPELFKKVIQDLRNTEYQVMLTTGDQVNLAELNPLPDNFYMDSYIPGSAIMKRSQVVICHGGNGTIYQALGAGLPVLALPTHVDQKANAHLLAKQMAGLMIKPGDLVQVMPSSVKHLFSDPSFRDNAAELKH